MTSTPVTVPPPLEALASLSLMYALHGRLGAGSYGQVFAATCKASTQQVAIKIMPHSTPGQMDCFALRELRACLACRSAHVMPLLRVIVLQNGTVCMVMPRFDGTLRHLVAHMRKQSRLLSIPVIRYLFRALVDAVAAAHRAGFVNRDIKPDNILIRNDGACVVLCDWGLARDYVIARGRVRALTPEVISTWYAPPEVLARTRTYTGKVDVWSLGVVLAELLAGMPIFNDTRRSRFFAHSVVPVLGCPAANTTAGAYVRRLFPDTEFGPEATHSRLHDVINRPDMTDELWALLHSMLTFVPADRPSLDALGAMPFLLDDHRHSDGAMRALPRLPSTLLPRMPPLPPPSQHVTAAFTPWPPGHAGTTHVTGWNLTLVQQTSHDLLSILDTLQPALYEAWLTAAVVVSNALESNPVDPPTALLAAAVALAHGSVTPASVCIQLPTPRSHEAECALLHALGGAVPLAPGWLAAVNTLKPQGVHLACVAVCFPHLIRHHTAEALVAACQHVVSDPDAPPSALLEAIDAWRQAATSSAATGNASGGTGHAGMSGARS